MTTITVLARKYGLSRSTLLYYDRIGLLSASYRTQAEARLYSAAEETRLARIVTFRAAGIPLETIRAILAAPVPAKVNHALEARLREIQQQIDGCRRQQRFIVELLKEAVLRDEGPKRTRDQWVELLRACAFTEADMDAWHAEMERKNSAGHARFLRKIGLSPAEVERVQTLSRTAWATGEAQPSGRGAARRRPRTSQARPRLNADEENTDDGQLKTAAS